MHAALVKGLQNPEVMERFTNIGATLHPSASPAEFATYIRREHERWGKVIKDANIKPE